MWESVLGGKFPISRKGLGPVLLFSVKLVLYVNRESMYSHVNQMWNNCICKKILNFLQAGRLWVPVTRARENVSKNVLYHDSFKITNHNNSLYLLIANGRFHSAYRALLSSSDNHDHDPCTINLCGQVTTQQTDKGVSSPCTKTADVCSLSPFDPCFKPQ